MTGGTLYSIYRTVTAATGPLLRGYLNRRAKAGKEDPERLDERFGYAAMPRPEGKLIWFHAASVGESLSAIPLLRAIMDENPDAHGLFTSGTVTSAQILSERLPKRVVHQFVPLDQPAAIARFLKHWKPDLAIWIESDLWPNALEALRKAGVPSALVNARMSEKSFQGWRRATGLSARILSTFDVALSQTQETADRLTALGAPYVSVTGNLKAAAAALPAAPDALQALRDMVGTRPVFAAASTHGPEEEMLGAVHLKLMERWPDLLTIIAPRHPDRGPEIAETLRSQGLAVARRGAKVRVIPETQVYLMDTIGELGLLYRVAPFVFVGGSLIEHGGQNPLEPARFGVPVLHGPNVFNFAGEYEDLDADGAAVAVADTAALADAAARWLADPGLAETAGKAAQAIADRGAGALDAAKAALAPILRKAGLDAAA